MQRLLNTLYVTNPDALLSKRNDAIRIAVEDKEVMSVPFHLLEGIVLFGHARCTHSLMGECATRGIDVTFRDEGGRFQARVCGPTSGNVLLRRAQYQAAFDERKCLDIAKRFVLAKIHNTRIVLQHSARDRKKADSDALRDAASFLQGCKKRVHEVQDLNQLRGIEGSAAGTHFSVFGKMLTIDNRRKLYKGRSKRPPTDPVNAALSFFYSMLARELTSGCEDVGLDPQMGYLHACRPGRTSLALDLIEELRAPIVDRFVLSLFNRRQPREQDFRTDGTGVYFTDRALKEVLTLWQGRKQEVIMHPFLDEKVPLGLLPCIQPRLLSRFLRGDLNDYPAIMWR